MHAAEVGMRKVDVDWLDVELAFRDTTATESFLDQRSGEVFSVVPGFPDELELRALIARESMHFLRLKPVDTAFARDVMRRFVERMPAGTLQRRLLALQSKTGAYTRSLALLQQDAGLFASFHRFEQTLFWDHVERYFAEAGVEPLSRPPGVELFEAPVAFDTGEGVRSSAGPRAGKAAAKP